MANTYGAVNTVRLLVTPLVKTYIQDPIRRAVAVFGYSLRLR